MVDSIRYSIFGIGNQFQIATLKSHHMTNLELNLKF